MAATSTLATAPRGRSSRDVRRAVWTVAVVATLAAVAIAFTHGSTAERRALVRMREPDRRALYDATLRDTQAVCAQAESSPGLRSRCADSARFLAVFPECDDGCRALARRFAHEPWR